MGKREFTRTIKFLTTRGVINVDRISMLSDSTRSDVVKHIVSNRGPIVEELIPEGFDMSWLASCAYMYRTKGKKYNWLCTQEHQIVYAHLLT